MENNNNKESKSFIEILDSNEISYNENPTLTKLLEENFEQLEGQIKKHRGIRNKNIQSKEGINFEDSFYVNLAKMLKNSSEFYG